MSKPSSIFPRSLAAALAVGATLALGACVSSRTYVLRPATTLSPGPSGVTIQQGPHSVEVSDADIMNFERQLNSAHASEEGAGSTGPRLILTYRFVHFETGDAPVRIVSGVAGLFGSPFYGLGDGALGVEATYTDSSGAEVGKILADGPIAGAFAGRGDGLKAAAKSIATFTRREFLTQQPVKERADADGKSPDSP